MKINEYNNPKNSLILFGLEDKLDFLIKLYNANKFPRVLMVTGKKGIGKFTLINHFLTYIYDKKNYDLENKSINNQTNFYKQYTSNVFPNIIHLSGGEFKNIKVNDIRELKSKILKSTILQKQRFIILDDIELFNTNSLNALLKIIEEPTINNYFILINNKSRTLINTITSRALEVKISLKNKNRMNIIQNLIKDNKFDVFIDYKNSNLTPGNFIIFNKICEVNKINIDENFTLNLNKLLNLYKKNKDINLINMIIYLTNIFFYNLQNQNKSKIEKINQNKNFVIDNINKFIKYNINQTSLLNALSSKLSYE